MYHALYRKYRPQSFEDVIGQETIVTTLKNSIKNNCFSHAYMFFGPRGTGKTTISKIFARNVNCLDPIDGNCCGKCKNCLVSCEKDCVDIIEIDAASNNGVDEIRDLRNKISLVPAELKYKVYIIDEVHMLSIGAFNALLKTLEEPPEHAIFILATTDPQKVPETIVSRCQCFSFTRISNNKIFNRLKFVCDEEKIDVEDRVLEEISNMSDGGLRDALSNLDKIISYSSDKILYSDFLTLNGLVEKNVINEFCTYIFNGSVDKVLNILSELNDDGKNLVQFLNQVMYYLRNCIVNYYVKNAEVLFDVSLVEKFLLVINERMFDIKRSENPQIYIEMLILQFIENNKIISREIINDNNYQKQDYKESSNYSSHDKNVDNSDFVPNCDDENITVDNGVVSNDVIENISDIMMVRVNNAFAGADKKLLIEETKNREKLMDFTFDHDFGYLVCNILDSKFRVASDDIIVLSYEYDSLVDKNIAIIDKLNDIYNKLTGSTKKFAIISDSDWDKMRIEYINNLKAGNKYSIMDEPEKKVSEVFKENKKNDILTSSAIELFGDIVEIK